MSVERADSQETGHPPKATSDLLFQSLSAREVLALVADGLSNREIAEELILAPSTVKWYVSTILDKFGDANRTQAGVRARELGLLD